MRNRHLEVRYIWAYKVTSYQGAENTNQDGSIRGWGLWKMRKMNHAREYGSCCFWSVIRIVWKVTERNLSLVCTPMHSGHSHVTIISCPPSLLFLQWSLREELCLLSPCIHSVAPRPPTSEPSTDPHKAWMSRVHVENTSGQRGGWCWIELYEDNCKMIILFTNCVGCYTTPKYPFKLVMIRSFFLQIFI